MWKRIAAGVLVACLSVLVGIFLGGGIDGSSRTRSASWTSKVTASTVTVSKVLSGLDEVVVGGGKVECSKVAVGYNANLDLIVAATDVLEKLKAGSNEESGDHQQLNSLSQFFQTFLYYFEKGSAAERYVEREVFQKILKIGTLVAMLL
jgi:ADP-dependent glucokinase